VCLGNKLAGQRRRGEDEISFGVKLTGGGENEKRGERERAQSELLEPEERLSGDGKSSVSGTACLLHSLFSVAGKRLGGERTGVRPGRVWLSGGCAVGTRSDLTVATQLPCAFRRGWRLSRRGGGEKGGDVGDFMGTPREPWESGRPRKKKKKDRNWEKSWGGEGASSRRSEPRIDTKKKTRDERIL